LTEDPAGLRIGHLRKRMRPFLLTLIVLAVSLSPAGALEIGGLSATPARFSPNGDGVKDSTMLAFDLTADGDFAFIRLGVEDTAGTEIRVLADGDARGVGPVSIGWDGRTSTGAIAEEGVYAFALKAWLNGDTTATVMTSTVLDVSLPSFSVLIDPNPYSPDLDPADSLASVEVSVTGAEAGDGLVVTIEVDTEPDTLSVFELSGADTTYRSTWDGRNQADGIYYVRVGTRDGAGNTNAASFAIDLDLEGPALTLDYPEDSYVNFFPDSVAGTIEDRSCPSGTAEFSFGGEGGYAPVALLDPGPCPPWDWYAPWPDTLAEEGMYTLTARASDRAGHVTTLAHTLTIDLTAPPVPSISDLPGTVSSPVVEIGGTGSSNDSVIVYVNAEPAARAICNPAGAFTASVELALGSNAIYAVGKDRSTNQSSPSSTVYVEYTESEGIHLPEHFGADSVIQFNPAAEVDELVLRIYSVDGRYITSISWSDPEPYAELFWDLTDSDGQAVRNGPYLMLFEVRYAGGGSATEKRAVVVAR
jgi:hypothetical protein